MTERKFRWTHSESTETELNKALDKFELNIKNIKPESKDTTAIAQFLNAVECGDYNFVEGRIKNGFDGCKIASNSITELFGRFVHVDHAALLECTYQVATLLIYKRLTKPGELI